MQVEALWDLRQAKGDESNMRKYLDWLSTFDYESKHLAVRAEWLPGTISWFWESPMYQAWSRGREKVLWVEGQSKLFKGPRSAVFMLTGYESQSVRGSLYSCNR